MKVKASIKKYLPYAVTLFFGNLLLAFAVSFFFINYRSIHLYDTVLGENGEILSTSFVELKGLLTGGTGGFSLIISKLFHISDGHVETIITITTVVLFIVGAIFLGKKFTYQTLISTILYPIFLYVFRFGIFDIVHNQINMFDPILSALIGGTLMGIGCGVIYRIGGSTGGFDIPGLIINKYTRIKLSIIFMFTDGLLVALALIAHFSLYEVMIGLIAVAAYSVSVGYCQLQGTRSYCCEIISSKWEEINKAILATLDRGTTIIDVIGGYTGIKRKMIKAVVSKDQYMSILDIVKRIDPDAFMSLNQTSDIFGEGYRSLNTFSNK